MKNDRVDMACLGTTSIYGVFEERLARTVGERSHGMFEERSTSWMELWCV